MKLVAFLFKIITAFLAGIIAFFIFIQNDSWYQHLIEKKVVSFFENSYQCHFKAQLERVNFLNGTLHLKNAHATSLIKTEWQWKADHIYVTFALFKMLFKQPIDITIKLNHLTIESSVTLHPAIIEHIKLLMKPGATRFPSRVKKFEAHHVIVSLAHTTLPLNTSFILSNFELYIGSGFSKVLTLIKNASCTFNHHLLFHKMQGTLHMQLPLKIQDNLAPFHLSLQGYVANNKEESTLTIDTHDQEGAIMLATPYNSYSFIGTYDNVLNFKGDFIFSLSHFLKWIDQKIPLDGKVRGNINCNQGKITSLKAHLEEGHYYNILLPPITVTATQSENSLTGTVVVENNNNNDPLFKGTWDWDFILKKGTFQGLNEESLAYKKFVIPPQSLTIKGAWEKVPFLTVDCTFLADLEKSYNVKIDCSHYNNALNCQAHCGLFEAQAKIITTPQLNVDSFHLYENKIKKAEIYSMPHNTFNAYLESSLIQKILEQYHINVPAQGKIVFEGNYSSQELSFKCELQNGSVYLPAISNIIQQAKGHISINYPQKCITLDALHCSLYKGTVDLKQATIIFDNHANINFLCIPCIFNECFVGYKKDIFAFLSGGMIFKNNTQINSVEGNIVIDQGYMCHNMFSTTSEQSTIPVPYNPTLNIAVETRAPLTVKTPFLETNAQVNVTIQGTLSQPETVGTIQLQKGILDFPYKPLFITQGTLYFLPASLNPLLEITARNTIKKYAVDLSIGGSLKQPTINFSSYPALAQEQIITLLLGGSEDGSLFLSMPHLLTQYVEDLLFGPAKNSQKILRKLKQIFKPLKNVRFVPNFTDKTGRGGVRGSLAIEVNDRLRGLIQQNFSLTEDTRLEVEYALSDDTSLRAVKDERGDVGAELEMRWKW
jgi:hypothetical protein